MVGLDTPVVVRYIVQHDLKQPPRATRLVESLTSAQPGFVPVVAVVELVWVLSSSHGLNRGQLDEALDLLLRSQEIGADRADRVLQVQRRLAKGGADFANGLIERIAQAHGYEATMTFDTGAAGAAGMKLAA